MEQKYSAPIEKVFALLTDPKWLEARSVSPGVVAKVLSPESDQDPQAGDNHGTT